MKILGALSIVFGLFVLVVAPGDRVQIVAYGNTGRLFGLVFMIAGILMLYFG